MNAPAAAPASNATNAPSAPKPSKRNPIAALDATATISGVQRDFNEVLRQLGWDPNAADVLKGGETVAMNGPNKVCTSKEIFYACESAWGRRPGSSSKELPWQQFDAGVARVMAQARRAHLIKDADGVVCDSPDQARKDGDSTPRPRKAASLLRDGTISGMPLTAAESEELVDILGGKLPGRDALAAALVSCGWVLVRDEASGVTTIEMPKPRAMTAEQTAKAEKADSLERKAIGLEKDGLAEVAATIRKVVADLRAEVDAAYTDAPAAQAHANGAGHAAAPKPAAHQEELPKAAPAAAEAPKAPAAAHAEHKPADKADGKKADKKADKK